MKNVRCMRGKAALVGFITLGALWAAAPAAAAMSDPVAEYQAMREACLRGETTHEDQQNCLREAGAALQEARRNRLQDPSTDYERNARLRCERVPAHQREFCLALRDSSAVTVRGSVEGGGILRERVLRFPADQAPADATLIYPNQPGATR